MRPLQHGDTIGIISPAFGMSPDELDAIQSALQGFGFNSKTFGRNDAALGRLAADDATRAANMQAAFDDNDVAAIICARGGYGSVRMLDHLDFGRIAAQPKPFVGYSDATTLLKHLADHADLVCFHGLMGIDFISKDCAASKDVFFDVITGSTTILTVAPGSFTALQCGTARGTLSGGNITVLESLMGAHFKPFAKPAILLLEDVGEFAYRLDRTLWHFRREGLLDGVTGVIFSDLKLLDDCEPNSLGIALQDVIEEHFGHIDGPIVIDMPCGHTQSQLTLPLGLEVELTVSPERATVDFADLWNVSRP